MATSAKKSTVSTAPMPKKPPKRGKVSCGVCQGPVVDGKDEALLCEGECGLWYHRGCASVPHSRYKELSNSEEPFLCLSCINMQLVKEVALLKNELRGVADVRERCAALSNDVSSLRQALDALRKERASSSSMTKPAVSIQSKRSYAKVVSTLHPSQSAGKLRENARPRPTGHKIKVDGARRIWNTMPTCSARAVAITIAKLLPVKLDFQVKHKTKKLANKTIWWFVVHGSEGDLTLLERDWEKVQHQTLWSLQNCFMSPKITMIMTPTHHLRLRSLHHSRQVHPPYHPLLSLFKVIMLTMGLPTPLPLPQTQRYSPDRPALS